MILALQKSDSVGNAASMATEMLQSKASRLLGIEMGNWKEVAIERYGPTGR
jgi:hypothetical protein